MILTAALNAALDLTYELDAPLRPGQAQRVARVRAAAGGKALNVARLLHSLNEPTVAAGLLGGDVGEEIARRLPPGLRHSFVAIAEPSRRAVVVSDGSEATGLWEPGPVVDDEEWRRFERRCRGLLRVARVAVFSGSLPPGVPTDAYGRLVAAARAEGVPTVLDCDGEALRAALPERPDVVKPNTPELEAAAGRPLKDLEAVVEAASQLRRAGARAVVASRGELGLAAVTADGAWAVRPPEVVAEGNPTGAGDACVAALARGLRHDTAWAASLAEAAALSAAAVRQPAAGEASVKDFLRLRRKAEVEEL